MGKKAFILILIILLVTFVVTLTVTYYQPESTATVSFDSFPLAKGDWVGQKEAIAPFVMDLLNPKAIFSATYTNSQGIQVHLLFDYFVTAGTFGGPHSPRNCLPGSGWVIADQQERTIDIGSRKVSVGRMQLRLDQTRQIMDFWYVTNYGETASDYLFKFYSMISSLALQPRDVAFVRLICADDPASQAAMEEFESLFVPEIYGFLPFD
jgi:EpsI family protein